MFKSWEELSRKEQLASEHYDFYKEVHGIRPRWMNYDAMSEQDLEEELASLAEEAKRVFAERDAEEQEAIARFEGKVAGLCKEMGKDRETIIRWMWDAQEVNGDWDYWCYNLGVPYGYFKEFYNV